MSYDIASRFTTTQRPRDIQEAKNGVSRTVNETVADYLVGDHYHAFTNPHFYESRHTIRCL
jgi:hypothetical protein